MSDGSARAAADLIATALLSDATIGKAAGAGLRLDDLSGAMLPAVEKVITVTKALEGARAEAEVTKQVAASADATSATTAALSVAIREVRKAMARNQEMLKAIRAMRLSLQAAQAAAAAPQPAPAHRFEPLSVTAWHEQMTHNRVPLKPVNGSGWPYLSGPDLPPGHPEAS